MATQIHTKYALQPTAHPRRPLAEAVSNRPVQHHIPEQQKQPKEKQPETPPLPRQNSKTVPPSPPKVIRDQQGSLYYERVGFLGEGGFARVYEVKDVRGTRIACKVVTKSSLKTKKAKTKLYAEIKIHRSLCHPNIVTFQECFEDEENVYMTLELCHSGSLMDMLRRRRRFTEPETRYFMVQLIGACHYMHSHQVIHRDLKLGNLFLDRNMNIKVGDFGLAALIENPGERKKTICGTPNYIAPEVLFDTANGHSFEVDTWSIGVILYTLAVGRPPFQTKEVKDIYKRIRDNDYEFPAERRVSETAKELVQLILTQDPQKRPTLHEIVDHPFFTLATFPGFIPITAYDSMPDFRHVTRLASEQNYLRVRREALLDEEQTSINVPKPSTQSNTSRNVSTSIAQQEKEFQKAVQPGSPISALLNSAKRPLMVSPASTAETNLYRKLQAAQVKKASPLRQTVVASRTGGKTLQNIVEEDAKDDISEQDQAMKRKLEAQKARIVAQMVRGSEEETNVPVRSSERVQKGKEREHVPETRKEEKRVSERENIPPLLRSGSSKKEERQERGWDRVAPQVVQENRKVSAAEADKHATIGRVALIQPPRNPPPLRLNSFDAVAATLTAAFDARAVGRLFRDPRQDVHLPYERVFITSWVDYCHKYGMAYALTDGSVGVYFNDTTNIILSADKQHFDYITSRNHGAVFVRKSYTVDQFPEELRNKVYLLKHFEGYIMDRLWGEHDYQFQDVERAKGMDWVQKYLRMKRVIVFKLSHDALQFNFLDHTKLILSSHGLAVTYIDKEYKLSRWTLSELMAWNLKGFSADADPYKAKVCHHLTEKVHYCKEVLFGIHKAAVETSDTM